MQSTVFKLLKKMVLIAGLVLVSSAAAAKPPCDQRDNIIRQLANDLKQAPAAVGLTESGRFIELLSSVDGQTWTIIVSNGDGTSCTIASGKGWLYYPVVLAQRAPKA